MGGAWDLGRWVRDTRGNHVYNGALPPPFCLRESRHFAHTNVLLPQLPDFDKYSIDGLINRDMKLGKPKLNIHNRKILLGKAL